MSQHLEDCHLRFGYVEDGAEVVEWLPGGAVHAGVSGDF